MRSPVCSSLRVKLCYKFLHLCFRRNWEAGFSHLSHLVSLMEWVPLVNSILWGYLLLLCLDRVPFLSSLLLLFSGKGPSWIVCQSIGCFLLIMTCGFEKRKMELALLFSPPSSMSLRRGLQSAGKPQSVNSVPSTQIPVACRRDSRITRVLLDELSAMA